MYSVDSHSINCVLSDIPSQITDVKWYTKYDANLDLKPTDGVIQGTTQTSTLSLSSAQLIKLKAAGDNPAHIFTCVIKVGTKPFTVGAEQTINVYTPGKQ